MIRRNFITGKWEESHEDRSGTYVVRNGKVVRLAHGEQPQREKSSRRSICSKKPWVSKSLGVHPKRQKVVNKLARKMGMDFHINERGFATATSAKGKRDAQKYFGMPNVDAGYGDICP